MRMGIKFIPNSFKPSWYDLPITRYVSGSERNSRNMKTLYVVVEPQSDHGNAIILPFESVDEARADFAESIAEGTASIEAGQYLVQLNDVTPEQYHDLFNKTNDVVASRFAGYNAVYLESFVSNVDDWAKGSLEAGTDEDEFNSSTDDYLVV